MSSRSRRVILGIAVGAATALAGFLVAGVTLQLTVWGPDPAVSRFQRLGQAFEPAWEAATGELPFSGVDGTLETFSSRPDFIPLDTWQKSQVLASHEVANGWGHQFLTWRVRAGVAISPDGKDYRVTLSPTGASRTGDLRWTAASATIRTHWDPATRVLTVQVTERMGMCPQVTRLPFHLTPEGFVPK